ncbi:Holliday junction branch migration protein RuvA [Fundidesulfovibrio terrae]|uniref:Holliday junction branch migration protein RuvA n=1 Tax=Fundidesulfovibrio terrae TaxID=2922866 RepID=UPI001FAFBE0A|nr:Holliday junction branch migration protein RuvA [Fundidesulfovibrio terrae]
MIAYLRGELLEKSDKGCLVLTPSGVGYELTVSTPTAANLPGKGEEASLYVHAQTGEDGTRLFGFASGEERQAFRALIGIPKLGPKTALAMLSSYGVNDLALIAAREDVAALSQVPGIGKKSAQRMILELKYALDGVSGHSPVHAAQTPAGSVFRDALAALTNLGYNESQAGPILREALEAEPDLDVAQAIRACLKKIAAAKA